jgi:hypothetical protein
MTIPSGDNWCSSCDEACHDHSRICTVCGTTLTTPPPVEAQSASASASRHSRVLVSQMDQIRASVRESRELIQHIHQEVLLARDAQQDLLASLIAIRVEFQGVPAELLEASRGRPTAAGTLDALPRIHLESRNSLLRQASISFQLPDGHSRMDAVEAVPGEFGNEGTMRIENAVIVVAEPRTGKGGLSEKTLQIVAHYTNQQQQKLFGPEDVTANVPRVILYLERGDDVSFAQKALLAERAGAAAVVIGNNVAQPWPYVMKDSKQEAVLLRIPVVMVKQSDGQAVVSRCNGEGKTAVASLAIQSSQKDCVICTEFFTVGDTVLRLPGCGHVFHETCALQWLRKHNTCPCCRRELATDDDISEHERRQHMQRLGAASGSDPHSSTWEGFFG